MFRSVGTRNNRVQFQNKISNHHGHVFQPRIFRGSETNSRHGWSNLRLIFAKPELSYVNAYAIDLNWCAYISTRLTFVIPFFVKGLVQKLETVDQHFPALEGDADPLFRRIFFPLWKSHSRTSILICSWNSVACTHLLFPSSILQRVFSISIVLWIKSEWGNCTFYTFISLFQRMVHHVPMYGRLLWLVVRHGYIARSNRVGTRPGVTHLTSGVHCTTK